MAREAAGPAFQSLATGLVLPRRGLVSDEIDFGTLARRRASTQPLRTLGTYAKKTDPHAKLETTRQFPIQLYI